MNAGPDSQRDVDALHAQVDGALGGLVGPLRELGEAGVRAVLAPGAAVDEIVAVMDDAVASRARHSAAGQ